MEKLLIRLLEQLPREFHELLLKEIGGEMFSNVVRRTLKKTRTPSTARGCPTNNHSFYMHFYDELI